MLKFGADKKECELEYNIFCNVKILEKSFKEEADNWRQHSAKMVYLIPRFDKGEYAGFLNAWLPPELSEKEIQEKHIDLDFHGNEVVMKLGYPINGPCRGFVRRSNADCPVPHIFVMSTGVEEAFKQNFDENLFGFFNFKRNKQIEVVILPESEDHIADRAATIERSVRKTY